MDTSLHRYADLASLTDALVDVVTRQLQKSLGHEQRASLVVPGGRTPVPFLEKLSLQPLAWDRVFVSLTDERWVSPRDPASNERLLRDYLLRNEAAKAHVVGLKGFGTDATAGATKAWQRLEVMPRPFDVVVLGMGDDGHFASLFPDDPASARGLDPSQPPGCIAVRAPVEPVQRVSLNLSALLQARLLILLVTGDRKWQVLEQERVPAISRRLPVHQLFVQERTQVGIYWTR
jgi:6-phosphogluconolactonase